MQALSAVCDNRAWAMQQPTPRIEMVGRDGADEGSHWIWMEEFDKLAWSFSILFSDPSAALAILFTALRIAACSAFTLAVSW